MVKTFLYFITGALFWLLVIFGIDRELARRDYVESLQTYKAIVGCIFLTNCNHYNNLLKNKEK